MSAPLDANVVIDKGLSAGERQALWVEWSGAAGNLLFLQIFAHFVCFLCLCCAAIKKEVGLGYYQSLLDQVKRITNTTEKTEKTEKIEQTPTHTRTPSSPSIQTQQLREQNIRTALAQIERDIHRTCGEHKYFRGEDGRAALRRVLGAYCARNPALGYTQVRPFRLVLAVFVFVLIFCCC